MKFNGVSWLKKDYEKTAFCLLFVIMAIYYGYRMFGLTPWYDELYTYYYFISRGPVYAAIHWPLPNNHVGYSVLSGFLDYLGNPYIGLRGVSYLCALANLLLLFAIGRKFFRRGLSLVAVILYLSMHLVNQLAVQGRGYTLGITCYLTAFYCLTVICRRENTAGRYYVLYALSLTMGIYTITSNVYWVLPLCLAGGIYLLFLAMTRSEGEKWWKSIFAGKLFRLIAASLIAAAMTTFLYAMIWLAIGANLLVKEESGAYFGMGHMSVILQAPFEAIRTGIQYMLATPYIQSVEREGFLNRLGHWFMSLFDWYYDGLAMVILAVVLIGGIYLIYQLARAMRRKEEEKLLLLLFLITGMVCMPLILLVQCALPYYRVFAYGGILLALLLTVLMEKLTVAGKHANTVLFLVILIFGISRFFLGNYQDQYGEREYQIEDALAHCDLKKGQEERVLCVTDCDQQYLLKFLYGITCENTQIEGAEAVLLDQRMTDPQFDEMIWEFYQYYDTIPWEYIHSNLTKTYENEGFVLYTKMKSKGD